MPQNTTTPTTSYSLVIEDLAAAEADWRARYETAVADAATYRYLLKAALHQLADRERELAQTRRTLARLYQERRAA